MVACLVLFLKVSTLLVFPCPTAGTTWSTDSSSRTSSMLVLRNLTPQVSSVQSETLPKCSCAFFTKCCRLCVPD